MGIKMLLLMIGFFMICSITDAQDTSSHPIDTIPKIQNLSWKNLYVPKTLLKLGLGYQKSFFSEIGVSRRKYVGSDLFIIGKAYYSSFEWSPSFNPNKNTIYGFKLGYEITTQLTLCGIEAKYQTDFTGNDFIITPKIGLGDGWITGNVISHIFVNYGYNISLKKLPFIEIGKHQVSIFFTPFVLSYYFNKKAYMKKLYK